MTIIVHKNMIIRQDSKVMIATRQELYINVLEHRLLREGPYNRGSIGPKKNRQIKPNRKKPLRTQQHTVTKISVANLIIIGGSEVRQSTTNALVDGSEREKVTSPFSGLHGFKT